MTPDPTYGLPTVHMADTGRRFVVTRTRGLVSIVCPSPRFKAVVTGGGTNWWLERHGLVPEPWRDELWWWRRQVGNMTRGGIEEQVAWRMVYGLSRGGFGERLFYGVLSDYSCRLIGTGIELWDAAEVPADRWFRDAWRRGPKGGPIWIDLDAARDIQGHKLREAIHRFNAEALRDEELALLAGRPTNGPAVIDLDLRRFGRRVAAAGSADEIKAVWPAELPRAA